MTTLPSASAVTSSDLAFYNESYGSLANFSVMCPAAGGWQQAIAGTVGGVVTTGSAGVYVDQIAASSFVPCFDPSHGHALGGGTSLIERIGRAVVPTPTCADVPTTLETRLAASLGKSQ